MKAIELPVKKSCWVCGHMALKVEHMKYGGRVEAVIWCYCYRKNEYLAATPDIFSMCCGDFELKSALKVIC